MNILSKNVVSSKAAAGTVIGQFSHTGAMGGTWNLDSEAQAFFATDSSGNLLWSPQTGAKIVQGFFPINVSAVFSGYDAEDSQFIIQVTA